VGIRGVHDLGIDHDPAFERRSWVVQRVGWVAIVALLVLALAGVLGSGPLSLQEATVPGLLRVEYQRFGRYQTPEALTVRLEPAAARGDEVRLWVDRRYIDGLRIEAITPPPLRVESAADRLVYVFPLGQPRESMTVRFMLQPEQIGAISGRVGLAGAADVATFRQFVYP
jgi:hypothetical protein